jgi:hypothetical protein
MMTRLRGPLADSYPAAVALVVFALMPFLLLTAAIFPLALRGLEAHAPAAGPPPVSGGIPGHETAGEPATSPATSAPPDPVPPAAAGLPLRSRVALLFRARGGMSWLRNSE